MKETNLFRSHFFLYPSLSCLGPLEIYVFPEGALVEEMSQLFLGLRCQQCGNTFFFYYISISIYPVALM